MKRVSHPITKPALMAVVLACTLTPTLAHAIAPLFAAGTTTFKNDIIAILTPIFGIAIIAVGVACWFGKISWNWFIGLVVGAILVFGNDQILLWVRTSFMV